jgi:hypothetical protein
LETSAFISHLAVGAGILKPAAAANDYMRDEIIEGDLHSQSKDFMKA